MSTTFSRDEISRYARHLVLPELGMEGQRRLKESQVALVGLGGLGSPLALYLAAAGVGHLALIDHDTVDLTNLQRQVLYGTAALGDAKTAAAQRRLADLNPQIELSLHPTRLSAANALDLLRPYDIVVDGSDNFPTRYLVNDAAVLLGKPNVYASIFRFEGQVTVFAPPQGPCYRCLYPTPPPAGLVPGCTEGGVLGVLPGVIGSLQATEVIKLITGIGEPLIGRLLLYDALSMRFSELRLRRNPACPVCGTQPHILTLSDEATMCAPMLPTISQLTSDDEITPHELAEQLQHTTRPFLLDVRNPYEVAIASIPGTSQVIPVGQLSARLNELDPNQEIVVYCRSGVRSERAVELLHYAGFRRVKNLVGGVLRWADEIDPSLPKY
ncbi:molybdopterin-synthase adenylyltransferase MoeB [Candidatus Oscillochloris fontis]|uniref:molybdopterin-synthase adenylyltransferase MoeB n=1 Tax=Candidatus Oscillochloris fontis TaxID=2496868 RepID=UPI00101C6E20|nr:molybdopterin-synthase adenylyltransferase MoeB [Candidatus Oscillochloris fontis]